jgi:hypothetical protein
MGHCHRVHMHEQDQQQLRKTGSSIQQKQQRRRQLEGPSAEDLASTEQLVSVLQGCGCYETEAQQRRREGVIADLTDVAEAWSRTLGRERGMTEEQADRAGELLAMSLSTHLKRTKALKTKPLLL